ncbi:FitA-like ribbon-helix-helix domain-containing protein [Rhodopila sp.]|uniref:FitA-like ribbon-helix-helix domain-containing protein n=1 Tax=Rhodopila sp. TaxID=2480087 RepID=UPI003D14D8AE
MSSITVRNLDPAIKKRLRRRAAEHGHAMEAEVRRILQTTLTGPARPIATNLCAYPRPGRSGRRH